MHLNHTCSHTHTHPSSPRPVPLVSFDSLFDPHLHFTLFLSEMARRRNNFLTVLRNDHRTNVLLDHTTHEHSSQLFSSERRRLLSSSYPLHPNHNHNISGNNPSSSSSPRRASKKSFNSLQQLGINNSNNPPMERQLSIKDDVIQGLTALGTPIKDLLNGSFKSSNREFQYQIEEDYQQTAGRPELWIGGQLKTFFTNQDLMILLANESYLSSTSEGRMPFIPLINATLLINTAYPHTLSTHTQSTHTLSTQTLSTHTHHYFTHTFYHFLPYSFHYPTQASHIPCLQSNMGKKYFMKIPLFP